MLTYRDSNMIITTITIQLKNTKSPPQFINVDYEMPMLYKLHWQILSFPKGTRTIDDPIVFENKNVQKI